MKPTRRRNQARVKSKKPRQEANQQRTKPKPKAKRSKKKDLKKQAKEELKTATTQPPTHYEPSSSVPGPQFGDPKRQEGSGVMVLATPAVPPAADCGTAPPCGGRLYGGPAVPLTFG